MSPTAFPTLPLEIWLAIAAKLPVSGEASLALTCHRFKSLLLGDAINDLNNDPVEKLKLLQLLDTNFPQHYLCGTCYKYHPRAHPQKCSNRAAIVPTFLHLEFRDVQSHLRNQRLGSKYGNPMSLRVSRFDPNFPVGCWYSFKTRVVGGHLLLRIVSENIINDMTEIQWDSRVQWLTQCTHYYDEIEHLCQCAVSHTRASSPKITSVFRREVMQCAKCWQLRRCHSCSSEYLVRIRRRCYPLAGYNLQVIRWVDLGDGQLPFCPEWLAVSALGKIRTWRDETFDLRGLPPACLRFEGNSKRWVDGEELSERYIDPLYKRPIGLTMGTGWVISRASTRIVAQYEPENGRTVRVYRLGTIV
ncbi:MAG: hypothetical protein Q9159_001633 [Coniocarpon cinnabarinum]